VVTREPAGSRRRGSTALLVALGTFTVAVGVWGALGWSLIPVGLDGTIERVDYHDDTGLHFVVLSLTDGRDLIVDTRVVPPSDWKRAKGARVHKAAGDTVLVVGGRRRRLAPSLDFWKVSISLVALSAFTVHRHRRREGHDDHPGVDATT
jgi:hypothetical protein